MTLPKIVITGRPNVGKSSLFNMLIGRRMSIVDPTPGITRDRVSAVAELPSSLHGQMARPCFVELTDTGGHGIEDIDHLTDQVEQQIAYGLDEATLILFVVDAQSGLTTLDEQVGRMLRTIHASQSTLTARIIVVANKVDGISHELSALEATRLGFGQPVMVSATSGYRKAELFEMLRTRLERLTGTSGEVAATHRPDPGVLMAIVGKRNAGKSTLVNTLAGEPRVIVAETQGTTRDAIDVRFQIDGETITAIDTAGVRKRKSLSGDIEFYSHHRSLRSIRRAHVVLFLIDATVPVSQVDKQLGNEVLHHYKPTVIVVNKWDLAEEHHTQEEYAHYLDRALLGFSYAPIAFISASSGQGMREVVAMAMNLHQQANHRVTTGELNRVMKQILVERTPHAKLGNHPKIYYASQIDTHPPTVGLWVNRPQMFDNNYQRFLLNRLRDRMPWSEVPIKLLIRPRRESLERSEA